MITNYIIYYLLCGVFIGFWLEKMAVADGSNVSGKERVALISLWPVMVCIFIYYFIKGFYD